VKWENGSETDPGSEKTEKYKNIILFFLNKSLFWFLIY